MKQNECQRAMEIIILDEKVQNQQKLIRINLKIAVSLAVTRYRKLVVHITRTVHSKSRIVLHNGFRLLH